MNGDPNKSSKGELVAGADRVMELSEEGVDAPDECAVDAGVIVAALSRETNLRSEEHTSELQSRP